MNKLEVFIYIWRDKIDQVLRVGPYTPYRAKGLRGWVRRIKHWLYRRKHKEYY